MRVKGGPVRLARPASDRRARAVGLVERKRFQEERVGETPDGAVEAKAQSKSGDRPAVKPGVRFILRIAWRRSWPTVATPDLLARTKTGSIAERQEVCRTGSVQLRRLPAGCGGCHRRNTTASEKLGSENGHCRFFFTVSILPVRAYGTCR